MRQPICKTFPVVWSLNGAFGQFSDPCDLFAQHLAPEWVGRQTGDGVNRSQQAQQDGDIAGRVAADLIK